MHVFTDHEQRTWEIRINAATMKRVRDTLHLNLYALIDDGGSPLGELLSDPVRLTEVLHCLCGQGISEEEFGRGMWGDVLEAAADAFVEEFIDFFQNEKIRQGLRRLITHGKVLGTKLLDRAIKELDDVDLESLAATWNATSGSSPARSASTPARSPSANSS